MTTTKNTPRASGEAAHHWQESAYSHGPHGELHVLDNAENITFAVVYFDRANPDARRNAENRAAFIVRACNSHAALICAGERLLVGLSKQSTATCDWYEGLEDDAANELRAALQSAQS